MIPTTEYDASLEHLFRAMLAPGTEATPSDGAIC